MLRPLCCWHARFPAPGAGKHDGSPGHSTVAHASRRAERSTAATVTTVVRANAINDRLVKLYRHGLVAQHTIGIRQRSRSNGSLPLFYSITRRGL
jgi:hypothetical protein